MPEYLSPGVYVEEIDTGNKPIEGVSTSTAGMEGLAERGPLNVPHPGNRIWGIPALVLADISTLRISVTPRGAHCYLPHAVEGFFTNGGKARIHHPSLQGKAPFAATDDLFDRGSASSADSIILRSAAGEQPGQLRTLRCSTCSTRPT